MFRSNWLRRKSRYSLQLSWSAVSLTGAVFRRLATWSIKCSAETLHAIRNQTHIKYFLLKLIDAIRQIVIHKIIHWPDKLIMGPFQTFEIWHLNRQIRWVKTLELGQQLQVSPCATLKFVKLSRCRCRSFGKRGNTFWMRVACCWLGWRHIFCGFSKTLGKIAYLR